MKDANERRSHAQGLLFVQPHPFAEIILDGMDHCRYPAAAPPSHPQFVDSTPRCETVQESLSVKPAISGKTQAQLRLNGLLLAVLLT